MNYKGLFILAFVCMVVSFAIGYYLGVRILEPDNNSNELIKFKNERDSLAHAFELSIHREQQYILKLERDSIKAIGLERSIAVRESKIKSYQQRLSEVSKITISKPDSFLINRYPTQ